MIVNLVTQLKNARMSEVITKQLQQWYQSKFENIKHFQFKCMPFLCQIYYMAPSINNEMVEIWLSDAVTIVKCKILKTSLNQCANRINSKVKNELQALRGSFMTVKQLTIVEQGNCDKTPSKLHLELLIEEMIYIDGISGSIVNENTLSKCKPLVLKQQECNVKSIKTILDQIIMQNQQKLHKGEVVYDATKYPEEKQKEDQFIKQFAFKPIDPINIPNLPLKKWTETSKLKITSNIRKNNVNATDGMNIQKQIKQ